MVTEKSNEEKFSYLQNYILYVYILFKKIYKIKISVNIKLPLIVIKYLYAIYYKISKLMTCFICFL